MINISRLNTRKVNYLLTYTGMGLIMGALFLHLNTQELVCLVAGLNLYWFGIMGEVCGPIKDTENNIKKN